MKTTFRILVDMDGILVDLLGKWLATYNLEHGDTLTKEQILTWDIHDHVKISHDIYKIIQRPGYFLDAEPLPGAVAGFKRLQELGHEVCVATAGASEIGSGEKLLWCKEHLGLDRKHVFVAHKKTWIDADVLIDDRPKTLEDWSAKGRLAIGIEYPYNAHLNLDNKARMAPILIVPSYQDTRSAWDKIAGFAERIMEQ